MALTNQDFLKQVFGGVPSGDEHLWVCSFKASPADATPGDWAGFAVPSKAKRKLDTAANTYFSTAILKGGSRRRESFVRMGVLVGDDAELDKLSVPPSYVLQTSPGKVQVGYILRDTLDTRNEELCTRVVRSLADSGLADKSGNNSVRYVRLPEGVNTKKRDTGDAPHVMLEWHPERTYELMDAFEAFGVPLRSESGSKLPAATSIDIPAGDHFDLAHAIRDIFSGESIHSPKTSLAMSFAQHGVGINYAERLLRGILRASPAYAKALELKDAEQIARFKVREDEVSRDIRSAYDKVAAHNLTFVEPIDIFSREAKLVYDPSDYPDVVSNLAGDIAKRMGVDPLIPAWAMLTSAASLIADNNRVQPKQFDTEWLEAARLWCAIVAPPSAMKTPAISAITRPLRKLDRDLHQQREVAMEAYNAKVAELAKAKIPPPKAPPIKKLLVNDITTEGLARVLEDNPNGILVECDELSGWFGSMDAYKNKGVSKDRSVYLQAYNGGAMSIDRAKGDPRYVPNFSVCILGGIQPDPMRRIAKGLDDDGLIQRFIPIPAGAASNGQDIVPDKAAIAAWRSTVDMLVSSDGASFGDPKAGRVYRYDAEAQELMLAAMGWVESLGRDPDITPAMGSALGKGRGLLARLSLVYHFLDGNSLDAASDFETIEDAEAREIAELIGEPLAGDLGKDRVLGFTIRKETVEKVVRLYKRTIYPALMLFYADVIGANPIMEDVRKVAGYILASESTRITARDVRRGAHSLKDADARLIDAVMEQLDLAGWVTRSRVDRQLWEVNPRVHVTYREKAVLEKQRREEITQRINDEAAERRQAA